MEAEEWTSAALAALRVRPVERSEEAGYQARMARHHYLGALPKIGETLWYVATWRDQWVAQVSLSAAALKCGVRDRWIGWDFRSQYGRLKLIANNSRFLILPEWHRANLGSRVLSLTERRVVGDWQSRFGHSLLLLETFVDPRRFHGGVYRAANWLELGLSQGYRRTREGYSDEAAAPKRIFVRPLCRDARARLTDPDRNRLQLTGAPRIMLNAEQMRSLPLCFTHIADPRRPQGRRHRLPVVLGIAAGAILCGMRGYKAIAKAMPNAHDAHPRLNTVQIDFPLAQSRSVQPGRGGADGQKPQGIAGAGRRCASDQHWCARQRLSAAVDRRSAA